MGQRLRAGEHEADFAGRNYLGLPATAYLGVTAAQLQSELQSGKTLAQVAKETSGKSEAGLIEALVAARKERLAAACHGRLAQPVASERARGHADQADHGVGEPALLGSRLGLSLQAQAELSA